MKQKPFISVAELARVTGYSYQGFSQRIKRTGELAIVKLGPAKTMVRREEAEAFLKSYGLAA